MRKIFIFLTVICVVSGLVAGNPKTGNDIFVKMRFYEGIKSNTVLKKDVISSYFLKPLFVGNIEFGSDEKKEGDEIVRIFNLKKIRVLNETKWGWRADEKKKHFEIVVLNSHKFRIEVFMKGDNGKFELSILNEDENKNLLKTALNLPEERSSVFGFEDSLGKPFFLSLSRAAGELVLRKEALEKIRMVKDPVLIKRVKPVYPRVAYEARVSGNVVIEAFIGKDGVVERARVLRGNPILSRAALEAVYNWRYKPYIVDGIPKKVKFYVVVRFSLDTERTGIHTSKRVKSFDIPNIWPVNGNLTSGFGERINPVTKKKDFHNGLDIAAKKGTNVIAPADGIVIFAGFKKKYGNLVVIDHKNGYISKYGQLSKIFVKKGEKIKKKKVIGLVGSSGISTGPHLHWEVHYKGKPVNPTKLIKD